MRTSTSIRALIVGVDGVIVVHPDPAGWSVHLERDLGLPVKTSQEAFFNLNFGDIVCGRAGPVRHRLGEAGA